MSTSALMAVKDAIGGESFSGYVDVVVVNGSTVYSYKNVYVTASYNIGYMQMDLSIDWNDDKSQPKYDSLGLHMGYNSNFQDFQCTGKRLYWMDGSNNISIQF